MQQHTERLGSAPLGKLLIMLSLPSIAGTVVRSLYSFVDFIWVAQLGYEAIAAVTVIFPYMILYYAIGGGTGIGVAALVSRRFGERNIEATNRVAGQIFLISAFWGLLFMVVAMLFADSILPAMGATPDIMEYAIEYLVITSYGAPVMILMMVMSSLFRGSGDVVKPMIIAITSSAINIILDPFMIFGIGPFPEMGISGAAWATVIAESWGALLGLYYLFAHKTNFRIKFSYFKPNISILKDIYRVGAPTAIHEFTESLSFLLFNRVVSTFGSIEIAIVGIVMRISDFAFMPIMGVSHGLLPVVGFNFGANNFKRLWESVRLASVGLLIFLVVATAGLLIFSPQIIELFSDNATLTEAAIPAMRIMLSTLPLIGPTLMFVATFQGLSNGTMALFLSLLRQFLFFIPILYLFRYTFGIFGVWSSMPASDAFSFLVTFLFAYREYRKHKRQFGFDRSEGTIQL
jgi:putative MATE family efflux protein